MGTAHRPGRKKLRARWMEVVRGRSGSYRTTRLAASSKPIEPDGANSTTRLFSISPATMAPRPEGGLRGTMNRLDHSTALPESLEDLAKHVDNSAARSRTGSYPAAWAYATSTPWAYGKEVTFSGGGVQRLWCSSWPAPHRS